MPPPSHLFPAIPLSGKSVALLLSASLHAAVALAAVRGAPHASLNTSLPQDSAEEIVVLDLTSAETPAPEIPAPKSAVVAHATHHHEYPVAPDHDSREHDPSLRHELPLTSAPNAPPAHLTAAAPAVVESPARTPPRFVMTVGVSPRAQLGATVENGAGDAATSAAPAQAVAEASVEVPAKLLAGAAPSYTREAEAAGIEADVPLEIVVDAAGAVIGARSLARVGYGLDEAALQSVRAYRFSPALR
ncbi:MAG TPA: TonB family protein, partial [Polyangiaceae bacterium]|nr:TonB family protein [Polyangiaceae bacterium]